MACSICLERFDAEERRPKVLPCGHSFCLPCLMQLPRKECPNDRKRFQANADRLPDNFMLLEMCEKSGGANSFPPLWCRDCQRAASPRCLDDHSVCSLKRARADRAAPWLGELEAGEGVLQGLRRALDEAADGTDAVLLSCRHRLDGRLDAQRWTRQQLQAALLADEAVFEEALKAAASQDGLLKAAARLLPALEDAASACSVSLRAAEGPSWTASLRPQQRPAARLLLCELLCAGELRRDDDGDEEDPEQHDQDREQGEQEQPAAEEVREQASETFAPLWEERSNQRLGEDSGNQARAFAFCPKDCLPPGCRESGPEVFDVTETSSSVSQWAAQADLLRGYRLTKVRALLGLRCDVVPQWAARVLRKVAPHVETLALARPEAEHVRIAQREMPRLTALHLSAVDTDLMRTALSMPDLTCLEAHCPFDAPLDTAALQLQLLLESSRLHKLRLGVYPLSAGLAVVRAHAATLRSLDLVAGSREPYGCPDLAAELRRCGLKKITKLVLRREAAEGRGACEHDTADCRRQKLALGEVLSESSAATTASVLCSECDRRKLLSSC